MLRYWTIHVSVLKDLGCYFPGCGELACLDFIAWISEDDDQKIALDYNGEIFDDYKNLKNDPIIKTSNFYRHWMRTTLSTEGKTEPFSSDPTIFCTTALEPLEICEKDMIYIGVAENACKILAHSKTFSEEESATCRESVEIVMHNIPHNSWRSK